MKKLKVLMLVHEGCVPPGNPKDLSKEKLFEIIPEVDVFTTLKKLGHEVQAIGLYKNFDVLKNSIEEFKPDVCFNMLEEFPDVPFFDHHVVSFLELNKIPYTGCNPRGLVLAKDKSLAKKILMYHRLNTAKFSFYPLNKKVSEKKKLKFPLFVKSASDEGSVGISKASLVNNFEKLKERVGFIHTTNKTHAIAEEFIEGREIYVGVLGNRAVKTFLPWELITKTNGEPLIATSKMKWDKNYQKKIGLKTKPAEISDELKKKFEQTSKKIFKILNLSGYARLDFRLTDNGDIYLIEANPNPLISKDEDFAKSAEKSGINYEELIQKILTLANSYDPML